MTEREYDRLNKGHLAIQQKNPGGQLRVIYPARQSLPLNFVNGLLSSRHGSKPMTAGPTWVLKRRPLLQPHRYILLAGMVALAAPAPKRGRHLVQP